MESTRDTADTAASPTEDTIIESAIPTKIDKSCSIISGNINFFKSAFEKSIFPSLVNSAFEVAPTKIPLFSNNPLIYEIVYIIPHFIGKSNIFAS